MIARTHRGHTVFYNLGWVTVGIFVCEALCRAFVFNDVYAMCNEGGSRIRDPMRKSMFGTFG